jgi:pimeloyl-ACP methyl ester carboxylesterase
VTAVFVHGFPETKAIWDPLRDIVDDDAVAVALPGFGAERPDGFSATKDAYAQWLGELLERIEEPVDLVGHDVGALLTMRVASAFDLPLRSWTVDVANIFHPEFAWPQQVHELQTSGIGEEMLRVAREADGDDPQSTASRLIGAGVPPDLARDIAAAHDEVMSRSMLDFYRSAVPNVAAGWWKASTGPTRSRGLVLLLPDPPAAALPLTLGQRRPSCPKVPPRDPLTAGPILCRRRRSERIAPPPRLAKSIERSPFSPRSQECWTSQLTLRVDVSQPSVTGLTLRMSRP